MNAPPRSKLAPEAFAARAISRTCSYDSTEQGPAIIARLSPPTFTPDTLIMESSGWNARLANLYGSCTCITLSTAESISNNLESTLAVSPIQPITVISLPCTICVSRPFFLTMFSTRETSSFVVCGFNTIIIINILQYV